MTMNYNVLLAGVSPDWLKTAASKGYDLGERMESGKIEASIKKMSEEIAGFKNTAFEGFMLHPGDDSEWEKFVSLLKSRKWDAISYGGGVRTIPQLGEYFTLLVHQAIKEQPQAKLLFPLLPEDVIPALRKHVPEAD